MKNDESTKDLQGMLQLINGSHNRMRSIQDEIMGYCLSGTPLTCEDLFDLSGVYCPIALRKYGWNRPDEGDRNRYFSLYTYDGVLYHMDFPPLERME